MLDPGAWRATLVCVEGEGRKLERRLLRSARAAREGLGEAEAEVLAVATLWAAVVF